MTLSLVFAGRLAVTVSGCGFSSTAPMAHFSMKGDVCVTFTNPGNSTYRSSY